MDLKTVIGIWCLITLYPTHVTKYPRGMCGRYTCSTGGLCSLVVAVTVVWTVEPCFIIVVGVTERASSDVPGACRTAELESIHMIYVQGEQY